MDEAQPRIVNVDDVKEVEDFQGEHWGGTFKPLTPALDALRGRLGVNLSRVPPGRTVCPFHAHTLDDEVFFVLSGRGVFRYGDSVSEIRAGDCISCPAGSGTAHQLANPYEDDLVYLAIGPNHPNEVCVYPDSGKVMVRSLHVVGYLEPAPYYDRELDRPRIFDMLVQPLGESQ
jgi:uncharacterized cupin superfamily protein